MEDPTRMAVEFAESLVNRNRFDLEDIFSRYLAWWKNGGYDTGPIAPTVFELVLSGTARHEAISQIHAVSEGFTRGCNPAHRSPSLAMAAFFPEDQLLKLAKKEAALTHYDPLAGDVSAAPVKRCRLLIRGVDWMTALAQASTGRHEKTQEGLGA